MYKDATPKAIYLKEYLPPEYLIDQVNLDFNLHNNGTIVDSVLKIRLNPARASQSGQGLFLHGEELELLEIAVNGEKLSGQDYRVSEQGLALLNPPEQFELSTRTRIYPENNTALEGLYRSGSMYCTQCEAEGFRKITWFLDRPDVMARFTTRVEADGEKYPVLLSNGNPSEQGDAENGRHYAIWDDPFPKPSYLFALVAGDLLHINDQHVTPSGRDVALNIYVEAENIDKCDHAMLSLKNAMRWDEEQYGREYDLDVYNIVAVNDFNMGAMENKGLNVFNSKYVLARQDTATDRDFQGIEGVIAHEYFHNWTGNRITCRDWFQLSLKEGFTVYRDQTFSADMGSAGVKRIEDVRLLRSHQFAEDAGPMAHPIRPDSYIEINNFYTVTVYEKGAEVVRMQANLLGPETFRKATDLYFERFDGQAVTTEDFVQCMQDASGRDMTQFRNWYDYAGTPELDVTAQYDEAGQSYTLTVTQTCPDTPGQTGKPPFVIPLHIGLLDKEGNDLIDDGMLEVSEEQQAFTFKNINSQPVPSLLRGFSAPVKISYPYTDEELMFLMSHDTDGFARWDASQTLSQRVLLNMVEQWRLGQPMSVPEGFVEAFRKALLDEVSDKALIAEVLMLPSASYLGAPMSVVDVDGLFAARQSLKQQLAESLSDDLLAVYAHNCETGDYTANPDDIARRSLKNVVLSYLAAQANEKAGNVCLEQYHAGHNMTDVMAAFSMITDSDFSAREEVIADFEKRWSQDPLVMDKWFTAQAVSRRDDTLSSVKQLMQHELFSIKNPNKVRSLVGAFCSANPVRFHQADGLGYSFLADTVIELNALNPQVAARMLRVISRWNRYDENRQQLMRQQLERIVASDGISKDVFEIAAKSLEA